MKTLLLLFFLLIPNFAAADLLGETDTEATTRFYLFSRLSMPAAAYSDDLVPLFDETSSFAKLESYLKGKNVSYTITKLCMSHTSFPVAVREQLIKFDVNDNVLIRGPESTIILKINAILESEEKCNQALETTRPG